MAVDEHVEEDAANSNLFSPVPVSYRHFDIEAFNDNPLTKSKSLLSQHSR